MADQAPSAESITESAVEAVGDAASAVKTCAELWVQANNKLEAAERDLINANSLKLTDLTTVLEEAQDKQSKWENHQRTVRFRGREIKVREIWEKIVHSISYFKNFFGKLAALDTSGHAALPWAVISLVIGVKTIVPIPCLEYRTEQLETVGDALTTVVGIIAYYVEFEKLYENGDWQVVKKLKSAIISVYTNILQVLCLVRGYYSDRERRGSYIFLFTSPDTFNSKLSSIRSGNLEVENYARLVRWEMEKNMANRVHDIQNGLKRLVFWEDIESLSPISSLEEHVGYSQPRVRDTGLWLIEKYEFKEWRYGPNPSLMLLTGSVGTGKSTLTSMVIDGFLHGLKLVDKQPVLYFYGRRGRGPEDVLRNLVRQLLVAQSDLNASPNLDFKGGPKLSAKDCLKLIQEFIKTQDCVAIIIDSLDACSPVASDTSTVQSHPNPQRYTFLDLFRDLRDILRNSNPSHGVKVFISCQSPSPSIQNAFNTEKWPHKYEISVSDQPETDIRRVIEYEVEHWDKSALLPSLINYYDQDKADRVWAGAKQAVVNVISAKAKGMFTWAILVLRWRFRDNKGLVTVEDIKDEFRKSPVPSDLKGVYDATYKFLYDKEGSPSSQIAGRAVKLLFCAKKVLSSAAFLAAVNASEYKGTVGFTTVVGHKYEVELRNLIISCLGWVKYDSERDIFRFEHPSIEDYLQERILNEEHKAEKWEADAHSIMAKACLMEQVNILSGSDYLEDWEDSEDDSSQLNRFNLGSTDEGKTKHNDEHESEIAPRGRTSPMPGRRRRNSSASSRASSRSESGNRPQTQSQANSHERGQMITSGFGGDRSSSLSWDFRLARVQDFGRTTQTDAEMDNPIQDFGEYATLYWLIHYKAARDVYPEHSDLERLVDQMLLESNYDGPFMQWIYEVQKILSQRPVGFYSKVLETELDYCIKRKPTPLQVACVYGLVRIVKELTIYEPSVRDGHNLAEPSFLPLVKNECGMSGLHLACRFGHLETVEYLATLPTHETDFGVIDSTGKSPLQYAIEAANTEVLSVAHNPIKLVDRVLNIPASQQFRTTNGVLLAALDNSSHSDSLLRSLLGRQLDWDQVDADEKTDELIVAVASYPYTTELQVERITKGRTISGEMLVTLASSKRRQGVEWGKRSRIWQLLIKSLEARQGGSPSDTMEYLYKIARAAIQSGDPQLAKLLVMRLIKLKESPLSLSKSLLKLALQNRTCPGSLFDVVAGCMTGLKVGTDILVAALENPAVDSALFLKLVQRLGMEEKITIPILKAAAMNRKSGAGVLRLMMARAGSITWTELGSDAREELKHISADALGNGNVEVLKHFVSQLEMPVTSQLLRDVIYVLPSEGFVDTARGKHNTTVGPLKLQSEAPEDVWDSLVAEFVDLVADKLRGCECITQDMLVKAASIRGPRVMDSLLRHASATPSASRIIELEHMVLEAAGNTSYGYAVLPLLEKEEDYRRCISSDSVLQRAARSGDFRTMTFLLGTSPLDNYSRGFRIAAAGNPDLAVTEYVFRRLDPSGITMEELEAGAATSDATFEYLLSRYISSPRVNVKCSTTLAAIIAEKCRRPKTMRLALESGVCEGPRTSTELKPLLWFAVKNEHGLEMATYLVVTRPYRVPTWDLVSQTLVEAAAANSTVAPEMLRLVFNLCGSIDIRQFVMENVLVKAAAGGRRSSEALRMLLMELRPAEVSSDTKRLVWNAIYENPVSSSIEDTATIYNNWLASEDPSKSIAGFISLDPSPDEEL